MTITRRFLNRIIRKVLKLKGNKIVKVYPEKNDNKYVTYQCNICGSTCKTRLGDFGREQPTCDVCGSTVRFRSIIHILSLELFGKSILLQDFPYMPEISGIGMTDWFEYAEVLAQKFRYTNTFYDKNPKLDITNIDSYVGDKVDFIISSDVFEHIVPPVSIAFSNCRRLLKTGGIIIFSVPYTDDPELKTIEHFPDLYQWEISKINKKCVLINTTKNGLRQRYDNLTFHGGHTLEMRLFSESSLIKEFNKAGFSYVRIYKEPYAEFGIYWKEHESYPMIIKSN